MPRRPRGTTAGFAYHVLNRAVRRAELFQNDDEYVEFEFLMREALRSTPVRLHAYCAIPNHWHLVIGCIADGDLARFMHRLTLKHAIRWHRHHGTAGTGPVYQGRYKSVRIETERHFLTTCRYVERNPLKAKLVTRVEDWRWSSLWRRRHRSHAGFLADWPCPVPSDWVEALNADPASRP